MWHALVARNGLQVLNRREATQVEEILSGTAVAGARSWAICRVSETVLDADPVAQLGATRATGLELA